MAQQNVPGDGEGGIELYDCILQTTITWHIGFPSEIKNIYERERTFWHCYNVCGNNFVGLKFCPIKRQAVTYLGMDSRSSIVCFKILYKSRMHDLLSCLHFENFLG